MQDNRQAVVTLKDQDWFTKKLMEGGGLNCVVMGQAVSGLQVFVEDRKYYAEFGIDQRAGAATLNGVVKPFDVAASTDCSDTSIRKAIVAVLAEKVRNDLETTARLVAHMKKDDIVPPEFADISVNDIVEKLVKKDH
jgi:hypothetical protein